MDSETMKEMAELIAEIKKATKEIKAVAGTEFPAVERNADRILASVKMLELNVTDVVELT